MPILAREKLEGALNVRTREPREFYADDEIELLLAIAAQVAQSIEHAKLYSQAQRRVEELEALARISEAVSESLYLEESLEAIVKTTMDAVSATGAALVLEDGKIAWPEGRAGRVRGAHAAALEAARRSASSSPTATRRSPTRSARCSSSIAHHAAVALEHGRAVMRGVLAQEIHHRVKNNLQTVASLLRLQARGDVVDAQRALDDSVNRILAIAAVHEVLTERRDESVDLGELLERLRAMLVQGLGAGKEVAASLEPVHARGRPRDRARARLLGAPPERARARRRARCGSSSRSGTATSTLAIADDGGGIDGAPQGTGLSIVEALVRDELGGTLSLEDEGGPRAPRWCSRPRGAAGGCAMRACAGRLVTCVAASCGGWSSVTSGGRARRPRGP